MKIQFDLLCWANHTEDNLSKMFIIDTNNLPIAYGDHEKCIGVQNIEIIKDSKQCDHTMLRERGARYCENCLEDLNA